eukprot:3886467-Rhodomonas_salina.1
MSGTELGALSALFAVSFDQCTTDDVGDKYFFSTNINTCIIDEDKPEEEAVVEDEDEDDDEESSDDDEGEQSARIPPPPVRRRRRTAKSPRRRATEAEQPKYSCQADWRGIFLPDPVLPPSFLLSLCCTLDS